MFARAFAIASLTLLILAGLLFNNRLEANEHPTTNVPSGLSLWIDRERIVENEDNLLARLTVSLIGEPFPDVKTNVSVSIKHGSTAREGRDYNFPNRQCVIEPGQDRCEILFFALNDSSVDPALETKVVFGAFAWNDDWDATARKDAVLTLVDHEAPKRIRLRTNRLEINEGSKAVRAVIALIGGTVQPQDTVITLSASASQGSLQGEIELPSQATIPAGSRRAAFDINAPVDRLRDGNHAVTITASLGEMTSEISLLVKDVDAAPTIVGKLNGGDKDIFISEGREAHVYITAELLDGDPLAEDVELHVSFEDTTSRDGLDYIRPDEFRIKLEAGRTVKTEKISLRTFSDNLVEGSEQFRVTMAAEHRLLKESPYQESEYIAIVDATPAPTELTFALSHSPEVVRDDTGEVSLSISVEPSPRSAGVFDEDLTIPISFTGTTSRYALAEAEPLVIAKGSRVSDERTLAVDILPDGAIAGAGSIDIAAHASHSAFPIDLTAFATIPIRDKEPPTGLFLSGGLVELVESGAIALMVTVVGGTDAEEERAVSVKVGDDSDSAKIGVDYMIEGGQESEFDLVLAPGDRAATVVLRGVSDLLVEGDEDFTVSVFSKSLTDSRRFVLRDAAPAEPTEVNLSFQLADAFSPMMILEDRGEQHLRLKVEFTSEYLETLPLELSIEKIDETTRDFALSNGNLTVEPLTNYAEATVVVTPRVDEYYEGDKTYYIEATGTHPLTGEPIESNALPIVIVDAQRPPEGVSLSITPSSIVEGQGAVSASLCAFLDGPPLEKSIEVLLGYEPGRGLRPDIDYRASLPEALTIPAKTTKGCVAVEVEALFDGMIEENETLTITSSAPNLLSEDTILILEDGDARPSRVRLTPHEAEVTEQGRQRIAFTLTLEGDRPARHTSIAVSVSGSATLQEDYILELPPSRLAPGRGAVTFHLTVLEDNSSSTEIEGAETIEVFVTARNGAWSASETAKVTIVEHEPPETIRIAAKTDSLSAQEGQLFPLTYVVELIGGTTPTEPTRVDLSYLTQIGAESFVVRDADGGYLRDYEGPAFIVIPANERMTEFDISFPDDDFRDGDKNLVLRAENDEYGIMERSQSILITDDDDSPMKAFISLEDGTLVEGQTKRITGVVALGGGKPLSTDLVLNVTFSGVEASAGKDYRLHNHAAVVTVPAYTRTGELDFELTAVNDGHYEGSERIEIGLRATHRLLALPLEVEEPARLTISDIQSKPESLVLDITPDSFVEDERGAVVTVKAIVLGGDLPPQSMSVAVRFEGVDDTATGRFAPITPRVINIKQGEREGSVTFPIEFLDNNIVDGTSEIKVFALQEDVMPAYMELSGSASISILDKEPFTGIAISAESSLAIDEAGGEVSVTARLTGGSPLHEPFAIDIVCGGSATRGEDYTIPDYVLVPSGERSTTFNVRAISDNLLEGNETVILHARYRWLTTKEAVRIELVDAQTPPESVSFDIRPSVVLEEQNSTFVDAFISLDLPDGVVLAEAAEVTLISSQTDGEDDFSFSPKTLVIEQGVSGVIKRLRIEPAQDKLYEGDENFTIDLETEIIGRQFRSSADLTIKDAQSADMMLSVDFILSAILEGRSAEVTLTASHDGAPRDKPVEIDLVYGGSASSDDYFGMLPSSITIPPGQTSAISDAFSLVVVDDVEIEGNERLTVWASSEQGGARSSILLVDNEEVPTGGKLFVDKDLTDSADDGAIIIKAMFLGDSLPLVRSEVLIRLSSRDSKRIGKDFLFEGLLPIENAVGEYILFIEPGSNEASFRIVPIDSSEEGQIREISLKAKFSAGVWEYHPRRALKIALHKRNEEARAP